MIGAIQTKKIVVMLLILMVPFDAQAMIVTENQARGFGGGVGVLASIASAYMVLNSPHMSARSEFLLGAGGVLLGSMSYFTLREYTHEQITKRADEAIEEMASTNLATLVADYANSKSVEKIMGAYVGLGFFENLSNDIEKYKPLLRYHKSRLEKAGLKTKASQLQAYYDRLENVSATLPECEKAMNSLLNIQQKIIISKQEQAKMQNETKEIEIKSQEANIKWWETYLNIAKWSYPKLITSGVALCFFLWSLKLPYPSFS